MNCPRCGSDKTQKNGKRNGVQQYRCRDCKKSFGAPDPDVLTDTLEDDARNPDEPTRAPREQKPGPKKVLTKTTQILGDGVAMGVMLATAQPDPRKNLTKEEAQSIGHPVVRMLARRVPGWLAPFLPKTKLNPEDAADLEEILATVAKWGMRHVTIMVTDFMARQENAQAARQQKQTTDGQAAPVRRNPEHPSASLDDLRAEEREAMAVPSSNGHNPAFDVLNSIDLGIEAA